MNAEQAVELARSLVGKIERAMLDAGPGEIERLKIERTEAMALREQVEERRAAKPPAPPAPAVAHGIDMQLIRGT